MKILTQFTCSPVCLIRLTSPNKCKCAPEKCRNTFKSTARCSWRTSFLLESRIHSLIAFECVEVPGGINTYFALPYIYSYFSDFEDIVSEWCWLMLIHAGFFSYADWFWCWLMLMLIDSDADWCCDPRVSDTRELTRRSVHTSLGRPFLKAISS